MVPLEEHSCSYIFLGLILAIIEVAFEVPK